MVGIVCMYWIHKYNLLYRSVVKVSQSAELSLEMTELLEYVLIIYTLSNFIFSYEITKIVDYLALIGVFIGIANAFLPMQQINLAIFPPRPDSNEPLTYH